MRVNKEWLIQALPKIAVGDPAGLGEDEGARAVRALAALLGVSGGPDDLGKELGEALAGLDEEWLDLEVAEARAVSLSAAAGELLRAPGVAALDRARVAAIRVHAGPEAKLDELNAALGMLYPRFEEDATIVFGVSVQDAPADVGLTLLAVGK